MKGEERVTDQLRGIVGPANLLGGGDIPGDFRPDGLSPRWAVFPKTREEVQGVVGLCRTESLAIIPRGNGTKAGMGGIPRRADLAICTRHLNRVVDQDCENLTLTLETGATLSDIQQRLRQEGTGYFIPLDPPFTEDSTLGGVLATNSSGPKRLLYGTARDLVLGMKVVMADGKIISCGGKTVKNVSGYDMGKLFIGSLGTLGIIVEATLRLLPIPEAEETFLASFSKSEIAFEVVREILKSQLIPSSLEILNPRMLQEINARPLAPGGDYVLAIGVEGVKEAVERQIRDLRGICDRFSPRKTELLLGNDQDSFWKAVHDSGLRLGDPFPQSVMVRINVPVSKTGQAFSHCEGAAREEGFLCALSSHAGSGILRVAFLFDQVEPLSDRVVKAIDQMTRQAVEMGGNLVVETAPASIRKRVKVWGQEGTDVPVFRQLKSQLDPSSLFNPGRFVGGI
jgi:glycolate oxidase FAD binding subunit